MKSKDKHLMKSKDKHLMKIKASTDKFFQSKLDSFIEKSILDNTLSDNSRDLLSYVPTKRDRYSNHSVIK